MANGDVVEMLPRRSAGRPQAFIDWDQVAEWIQAGVKGPTIARRLSIHEDVLYHRCKQDNNINFSNYSRQIRAVGDDTLHEVQYRKAVGGNVPLLIWLGKNRLGQSDQQTITNKIDSDSLIQLGAQKLVAQGWDEIKAIEHARNYYTSKQLEAENA